MPTDAFQQRRPVRLDERLVELGRQPLEEPVQVGAADPLDDIGRSCAARAGTPAAGRVVPRSRVRTAARRSARADSTYAADGSTGTLPPIADRNGSVAPTSLATRCDAVGPVRRYLHGELATRFQRVGPACEHRLVVGHPLQAGVREHDVVVGVRCPAGQVAELEAAARVAARSAARSSIAGDESMPSVSTAPEPIDGGRRSARRRHIRDRRLVVDCRSGSSEADQLPERRRPLGVELAVLLRVPVAHDTDSTCI